MLWSILAAIGAYVFLGSGPGIAWFGAYLALIVGSLAFDAVFRPPEPPDGAALTSGGLALLLTALNFIAASAVIFGILAYALAALRGEQAKTDRLLLNILPAPIAERMRTGESTIADSFDEVTILFADVVGFTRLAAALFDVPTAFISLVDQDRQWLKSCHGLSLRETPREVSFCAHAILSREVTVVPDALLDPRFADNPMVVGDPRIRFYAGYPLILSGGDCVGTLCVVDTRPRHPDETAIRLLRDLGGLAEQELAAVGNSGTEHPSNDAGSSLQPHVARARSGGPYAPS